MLPPNDKGPFPVWCNVALPKRVTLPLSVAPPPCVVLLPCMVMVPAVIERFPGGEEVGPIVTPPNPKFWAAVKLWLPLPVMTLAPLPRLMLPVED